MDRNDSEDGGDSLDLTPAELATILAALRLWQEQLATDGALLAFAYPHFALCDPLSFEAIDTLCERLNLSPLSSENLSPHAHSP